VEDPPRADEIRAQLSGARQALSFGPYQSPPPLPQMQYLQQQTPPEEPQPRGRRNAFSYPDTSPRPARRFEAGTIWVANMPHGVTQEQLVDAFSQYGLILSVDVVSREHVRSMFWSPCCLLSSSLTVSPGGSSNTFAFVKFQSDESAVAAVNAEVSPSVSDLETC
jgi:RNA recognition motif-containing protein